MAISIPSRIPVGAFLILPSFGRFYLLTSEPGGTLISLPSGEFFAGLGEAMSAAQYAITGERMLSWHKPAKYEGKDIERHYAEHEGHVYRMTIDRPNESAILEYRKLAEGETFVVHYSLPDFAEPAWPADHNEELVNDELAEVGAEVAASESTDLTLDEALHILADEELCVSSSLNKALVKSIIKDKIDDAMRGNVRLAGNGGESDFRAFIGLHDRVMESVKAAIKAACTPADEDDYNDANLADDPAADEPSPLAVVPYPHLPVASLISTLPIEFGDDFDNIFTHDEIARLLKTCDEMEGYYGNAPARIYWSTLHRLSFAIGERMEALVGVHGICIDWQQCLIHIQFEHDSACFERTYVLPRQCYLDLEAASLFTSTDAPYLFGQLSPNEFFATYRKLLDDAGLTAPETGLAKWYFTSLAHHRAIAEAAGRAMIESQYDVEQLAELGEFDSLHHRIDAEAIFGNASTLAGSFVAEGSAE